MTLRILTWPRNVERMVAMRLAYKLTFIKSEAMRLLGRPIEKWR
jgi:hypothetical protein